MDSNGSLWVHTNFTSTSCKNNVIANCYVPLTVLQSLVGFSQPSTKQSTKTFGNDLVFVKNSKLESKNHISLRKFHEQQNFHFKITINQANERDSLFEMQKVCFICSIQQ